MITCRFKQTITASIHKGVQRTFCSAQEFLDYYPATCLAKPAPIHHFIDSGLCLGSIRGNDYSFSQSKAVCFDHDGKFHSLAIVQRFAAIGECPRFCCGNLLRAHQLFCENFRRFQACCRFCRTKRAQPFSSKKINNPCGKRIVRTDDGQIDAIFPGETKECIQVPNGNRDIFSNLCSARVSWRAENSFCL